MFLRKSGNVMHADTLYMGLALQLFEFHGCGRRDQRGFCRLHPLVFATTDGELMRADMWWKELTPPEPASQSAGQSASQAGRRRQGARARNAERAFPVEGVSRLAQKVDVVSSVAV